MLNTLFASVLNTLGTSLNLASFCVIMASALILGAVLMVLWGKDTSRSFRLTLALLPAVVAVVIMMVSGSLGAGIAVAGAFSLVRFRSQPGSAREICAIFLSMAIGLACGMGYIGFAALFTILMCAAGMLYEKAFRNTRGNEAMKRLLRITVPEDLDYCGVFDDIFPQYTNSARLIAVKTTNLGSLNRLRYEIELKDEAAQKPLVDALRCRNGNLEISITMMPAETASL